jgi:hypothetical protein
MAELARRLVTELYLGCEQKQNVRDYWWSSERIRIHESRNDVRSRGSPHKLCSCQWFVPAIVELQCRRQLEQGYYQRHCSKPNPWPNHKECYADCMNFVADCNFELPSPGFKFWLWIILTKASWIVVFSWLSIWLVSTYRENSVGYILFPLFVLIVVYRLAGFAAVVVDSVFGKTTAVVSDNVLKISIHSPFRNEDFRITRVAELRIESVSNSSFPSIVILSRDGSTSRINCNRPSSELDSFVAWIRRSAVCDLTDKY